MTEHEIKTSSSGSGMQRRWRACCSKNCGWVSPRAYSTEAAAQTDGDEHVTCALNTER